MEKWKSFNDYYEISTFGNIRRKGKHELKKSISAKGYVTVTISVSGKTKTYNVHRIVAESFIPNTENKPQINHKDGNKLNNNISNLEWVTNLENRQHAVKNGLHNVTLGEIRCTSKLTENDVKFIKVNYKQGRGEINSNYLSKKYGVSKQTILNIINEKKWKHIQV